MRPYQGARRTAHWGASPQPHPSGAWRSGNQPRRYGNGGRYCESNPDGGRAECHIAQELSDDEIDRQMASRAIAQAAAALCPPHPEQQWAVQQPFDPTAWSTPSPAPVAEVALEPLARTSSARTPPRAE